MNRGFPVNCCKHDCSDGPAFYLELDDTILLAAACSLEHFAAMMRATAHLGPRRVIRPKEEP